MPVPLLVGAGDLIKRPMQFVKGAGIAIGADAVFTEGLTAPHFRVNFSPILDANKKPYILETDV